MESKLRLLMMLYVTYCHLLGEKYICKKFTRKTNHFWNGPEKDVFVPFPYDTSIFL